MNTSPLTALNNAQPGSDPVSLLMLRKTLDLQAQNVAQLLQPATSVAPASSNPPHLGQNIDIKV
ncbi:MULTISPECIES: YjfB family protein [unclassified Cupriavidus]|uniref:YjfB family protein n=1 Tax=unclassified Cupriavidus TaxID=2640874 RepID=UPI0008867D79|nr:YjfB family protein [Cupriavidus sp. YR651]SDD43557.1 Putative motility protein [Cupriavidus sp. YR651]